MEKLSISIVSYNDSEDVLKAVRSIEECTSSLIEKKVYIVDNSEGDSLNQEEFQKALCAWKDVEFISSGGNIGFGAGHNKTLGIMESEYHAIVNPDIILKEDTFAKLISFMDKNPDCGMCVPRIITPGGELQKAYRRELTVLDMFLRMFIKKGFNKRKDYHTMQDMDYSKVFEVPFAQGSFLLVRSALFKELGGFDDRFFLYMEDADLCKRVNEKASLLYCPDTYVIHKWEKGSHKNKKLFKLHVSSMKKYFQKWGWKFK